MWPRCFRTSATVSAGHGTVPRGPVSVLVSEMPPCSIGVLVVFGQCSALGEPPELASD